MRSKLLRRTGAAFFILIILWLICAQIFMKYRISDKKAKEKFLKPGIQLVTQTFEINGFRVHYAKTGSNTLPTLFFVHGSPGGWYEFKKYMQDKDLLNRFRIIAVDRPGFGYSQFGEAKNLQEQSILLYPLIKSLQNGQPFYAVGHSLGGAVIVKLQVDYENLFSGLVFLAAAVDPEKEKPEKWRLILKKFPLKYFLPGAFRPSNTELIFLKQDLRELDKQWEKIACPVWILHGDNDRLVPVENVEYAKKKLVNAKKIEVKFLPGAGHFFPWQRFEEVKEMLMKLPV